MHRTLERLALALLLVVVAAMAEGAEIRLRGQATSSGAMVTLGDVAEVLSADAPTAEHLTRIELLTSPLPGAQRFLRVRELQDLLLLRGVNLAEHQLSGSNQVMIVGKTAERVIEPGRPTSTMSRKAASRADEAIAQYLRDHVAADEPWTVRTNLTAEQTRALVDVPGLIQVSGGAAPWSGRQHFELQFAAADQGTERLEVEAEVAVPPRVVVLVRPLSRGAVVRETDVAIERASEEIEGTACQTLDEVVGRETTRTISAGHALTTDSLRAPLCVRRGDVVTIYARCPGIQIRTTARAKDNGAMGELIAVESFHDRSSVFARVCGNREVEVLAQAPRVEATRVPARAVASNKTMQTPACNTQMRLGDATAAAAGDCPDFGGEVRENGTVPLGQHKTDTPTREVRHGR